MNAAHASSRPIKLDIGILYSDMLSGAAAQTIAQRVAVSVEGGAPPQMHFWSFRELHPGDAHSPTAHGPCAAALDILIIASVDGSLTEDVRTWVEEWINRDRTQRVALALLLDPASVQPATKRNVHALRNLCRNHPVDFMFPPVDTPFQGADNTRAFRGATRSLRVTRQSR
jgi:hypothetical protein